MPLLKKHILSPGKFRVSTGNGPVIREFSLEDLKEAALNTNTMLTEGLKVPAPFGHKKEAVPQETADSSFNNAGYWELFQIEPTEKGDLALYGYLNAPGTKEEPESPFYKAMNTAKEVSLAFKEKFVDGRNKEWNNILSHVALVNYPVFHGQEEFSEFSENSLTVNMSMAYSDKDPVENEIPALRKALLDCCNISLPECHDIKQFVRDLLVAVLQKKPAQGSTQTFEISPVYMSTEGSDMKLTIDQAKALIATKAVNPATSQPFTLKDFGYSDNPNEYQLSALQEEIAKKDAVIQKQQSMLKALSAGVAEQVKKTITSRINQLVNKGVITKTHAEAQLLPKLEFQMSLDDSGNISSHPLEVTLSTLEAITLPPAGSNGGTAVANPLNDPESVSMSIGDILKEIDEAIS